MVYGCKLTKFNVEGEEDNRDVFFTVEIEDYYIWMSLKKNMRMQLMG